MHTRSLAHRINKYKIAYLWISPFFILFLVFWAYPIVNTFVLSLQRWEIFGPKEFVGFANFEKLVGDGYFWRALANTLYYWVAIVPLRSFLCLVLAAILSAPSLKFKGFFRAAYLLPHLVSIIFVGVLFRVILAKEGGWVNVALGRLFNLRPIPWLVSTAWSKLSITLMIYWSSMGYFTIIMIGGLQRISQDLYEAARIDGARALRMFFAITVPLAVPTLFFVVMVSTISTFSLFEGPVILTAGGPAFSSTPLTLYLYSNAFDYFKMGYASSLAVVMFVIIIGFSVIQNRVLKGNSTE